MEVNCGMNKSLQEHDHYVQEFHHFLTYLLTWSISVNQKIHGPKYKKNQKYVWNNLFNVV